MRVHLQLFSILKDCLPPDAERGHITVDLPEDATLADLVCRCGIARRLGIEAAESLARTGWQVLVNGDFEADMARPLQAEDQVSIFPPMAGG